MGSNKDEWWLKIPGAFDRGLFTGIDQGLTTSLEMIKAGPSSPWKEHLVSCLEGLIAHNKRSTENV